MVSSASYPVYSRTYPEIQVGQACPVWTNLYPGGDIATIKGTRIHTCCTLVLLLEGAAVDKHIPS